jgi:hypothetical protein
MTPVERQNARHAKRRALGLCARCGEPSGERYYCPSCAAWNALSVQRWRDGKRPVVHQRRQRHAVTLG